jgi:hypothetical protein
VTLTCRHVISWHGSRSRQGQQTATQRSGEAVAVPGSSSTTRLGTSQQLTAIAIATHEPASFCARTPHSNATMHPMRRPSSPSRSVWAALPRSAPSPRPPCSWEHVCGYLIGATPQIATCTQYVLAASCKEGYDEEKGSLYCGCSRPTEAEASRAQAGVLPALRGGLTHCPLQARAHRRSARSDERQLTPTTCAQRHAA